MFRILFRLTAVVAAVAALAACGTQYQYGGRTYQTGQETLAAMDENIKATIAKIPPREHTLGRSAVVIMPSRADYAARGIRGTASQEAIDYLVEGSMRMNKFMVGAIKKRNLFDTVSSAEWGSDGDPTVVGKGADWYLWWSLSPEKKSDWQIKKAGGEFQRVRVDRTGQTKASLYDGAMKQLEAMELKLEAMSVP